MSIRETIDRVRQAEEEADRILEEARIWGEGELARARTRSEELIEEARRSAENDILTMRSVMEEERGRKLRELDAEAAAEKADIESRAERNAGEALKKAMKIFLDYGGTEAD